MNHPQLVEFAKAQRASGASRTEIEDHLRRQKWDEDVIADVLAASEPAAGEIPPPLPAVAGNPPRGTPWRPILLGLLLLLTLWGGYQLYRHFAVAQLVREQTKFVEFRGFITGRLEAPPSQPLTSDLALLEFQGSVDSSQIDAPRGALQVTLDRDAAVSGALHLLPRDTDAHLLALTFLSVAGGAQALGGLDLRLADWDTYIRPHRTPFSGNRTATAVAGLVNTLLGPNILADFWLKIPARESTASSGAGLLTTEQKATWALLFRPTDKVFGESRELRFLGREPGGEINGQPAEIHRYALDGPWLTDQLVGALRQAELENQLEAFALIQSLVTGSGAPPTTASLDSLEISGGELDVWVGRQDTLPHRMTIRLNLREGQTRPLALQLAGEINITYGNPVAIEVPTQALDLRQLQEQLELLQSFGNMF